MRVYHNLGLASVDFRSILVRRNIVCFDTELKTVKAELEYSTFDEENDLEIQLPQKFLLCFRFVVKKLQR